MSARHFIIYADFSANQKLFIRYGTAYFFAEFVREPGAVFKRTAIFPAAVVKRAQKLGAEIAVAEFEINPIDADLCQKVAGLDIRCDGLFNIIRVNQCAAEAWQRFDADASGKRFIRQFSAMVQLHYQKRVWSMHPFLRNKPLPLITVVRIVHIQ